MIVDVRDELAREAILILQEIKQDLLTFDQIPVIDSGNPVKSMGIYAELSKKPDTTYMQSLLDQKQNNLTFDPTPTQNSTNPVTSHGIFAQLAKKIDRLEALTLLDAKQDTLVFDNTPTEASTNPVTSQGIKQYIDDINSSLSNRIGALEDFAEEINHRVRYLEGLSYYNCLSHWVVSNSTTYDAETESLHNNIFSYYDPQSETIIDRRRLTNFG